MKNGYERFIRPLLFSLDAETAHDLTIALLRSASRVDLGPACAEFFSAGSETENGLRRKLSKSNRARGWTG